ncbi:cytochrome P450 [Schizothecium vesticola]|uniref:Cytochrome P450 n=1 Tax=Schizothecium vesticola TaxID=314040 RepID=A0AA40K4U5_9PEZI|nr:cytochrome P450 [Schizothecium vesticola]
MGLVEMLLEHVSLKGVLLSIPALFVAWLGYITLIILSQNFKLARRGPRANSLRSRLPLGLDIIYNSVQAAMNHRILDQWRMYLSPSNNWTAETRIVARRIIFTAHPDNIKAILATQFNDFGKGAPFHREWSPFLGDSIFTTDGDLWHGSRQLIRPQFIKDRVSDLHTFESHMQLLFRAIANGGALPSESHPVDPTLDGVPVDISDLFFRFTLDSATDFLLGHDIKSLSTPLQPFAEAFAEAQRMQNIFARAGPLGRLYIDLALRLSPAELESKTKSSTGYTFLHALASFTRDRRVLHDQLIAVLLASRDTTASTLSWTLYELARHPAAVAALRAEILAQVGPDRAPTYDDLKAMRYLQAVMAETLRLYPSVPFNVRLALRDTTLPVGGGPDGTAPLHVLKDTPVGYSTLLMQRRGDLYPDGERVEEFEPERWGRWQPRPWQYIPFNGGPRICIGQQFALTEMGYVLTRLFQRFERVESLMGEVDGGRPMMKAEIVLQPGQGVRVKFFRPKGGEKV